MKESIWKILVQLLVLNALLSYEHEGKEKSATLNQTEEILERSLITWMGNSNLLKLFKFCLRNVFRGTVRASCLILCGLLSRFFCDQRLLL